MDKIVTFFSSIYDVSVCVCVCALAEDRLPPKEIANKEFILKEGERKKVTTDFLSFTDVDSEPGALLYQVLEGPHLGHLELNLQPGITIDFYCLEEWMCVSTCMLVCLWGCVYLCV